MRVVVVYKERMDYTREVESYMRDFERFTGHALETLNPETREGISFCTTYDILEYPTIIALSGDGQMQHIWKGLPLPTMSEVSYYV